MIAIPAIAVTIRVKGQVFLPKQLTGYSCLGQLV
jgi:hypothetical protein